MNEKSVLRQLVFQRKARVISIGFLFMGLYSAPAFATDIAGANGTIIENRACEALPERNYDEYVKHRRAFLKGDMEDASREGYTVDYLKNLQRRVFSRDEFEARRKFDAYECRRITYWSDGLRVAGFIWKPKIRPGAKLPLVIVNRGGNPTLDLLKPESHYYPFVTNGFVVIGSQYRGADGGEGRDEFGGADVNDVLNLFPLAESLGYVDMENVFMHGVSRGGMQTLLAVRRGARVNAVSIVGALTDLEAARQARPDLTDRVWSRLIPDYSGKKRERFLERSAVHFAQELNVPILILHGGADWRSDAATQSIALAQRLQSLRRKYELHIYADDDHAISLNREDRDRRVVNWFREHLK